MANESHHTESSVDDPSAKLAVGDSSNAIKVSRQFMILLEDYRYLMACYQETCGCHVNFDHQVFFRKLEEKYNILADIAASNSLLSNALNDNCDYETLNQLWTDSKNLNTQNSDNRKLYIKRIKICNRPLPVNKKSNENNPVPVNNDNDQEMAEPVKNNVENLKSEKLAFRCAHVKCDFLTFNQDDILKHIGDHDGIETSKKYEKTDVFYVCDQCGKEFTGSKWLENHIENVHAYVKVYNCDYQDCTYKTKFRCVMDDHRKRHGAIKEFKCTWPKCDSEFVTKRDMFAHINFFHKSIKNYNCTWNNCTASFKDSNRLRHHLFTHTGERPYLCNFPGCCASFKQMPHLHKHRKTHANDGQRANGSKRTSTGMIVCPIDDCNSRFPNEGDLNKHVAFDHPTITQLYKCETSGCNLYFANQDECQLHMKQDHNYINVITIEEEIQDPE